LTYTILHDKKFKKIQATPALKSERQSTPILRLAIDFAIPYQTNREKRRKRRRKKGLNMWIQH
jgi:hypothetical protein